MAEQKTTRTVYVLLSKSGTLFSRLMQVVRPAEYTHSSIGFVSPRGPYYSFARRHPRLALPAGMIREQTGKGYFGLHPETPCQLLALEVEEEAYWAMRERTETMYERRWRHRYNLIGTASASLNVPFHRQNHFFCSQFVASTLAEEGGVTLPVSPDLIHPLEFRGIPGIRSVYTGTVGGLEHLQLPEE